MKRAAFLALWFTLGIECAYIVCARLNLHARWQHLAQPILFVVLFGCLALARARFAWLTALLRAIIGLEFALSVSDRFGLLGPPGGNVSWGDFAHFVVYTRQVNSFLPASSAFPLAILATICEFTLSLSLIFGVRLRYSTSAAAVLLCLFGSAMMASGMIESQFFYAVFVLASGAWVMAATDASWMSVDRLIARAILKRRARSSA
ncbi:MAG TPA: hypothetical protein VGR72_08325 [Candidatus Acidoferrales bacterium]|nr:hypothetical protein [Candidatus Acidoferrales bacterium]